MTSTRTMTRSMTITMTTTMTIPLPTHKRQKISKDPAADFKKNDKYPELHSNKRIAIVWPRKSRTLAVFVKSTPSAMWHVPWGQRKPQVEEVLIIKKGRKE